MINHPAKHLVKLALGAADGSGGVFDLLEEHPEVALVPVGGLAGAALTKDKLRGSIAGLLGGGGAALGSIAGNRITGDSAGTFTGSATGGLASYLAARKALAELFPEREKHRAKEASLINELKAVKQESDARNWKAKHGRIRELLRRYPNDFYIDSSGPHNIVGITHRSTGFRYHMPLHALPDQWVSKQTVPEPNTNAPRHQKADRRSGVEVSAL
jgi:hypothetical protein